MERLPDLQDSDGETVRRRFSEIFPAVTGRPDCLPPPGQRPSSQGPSNQRPSARRRSVLRRSVLRRSAQRAGRSRLVVSAGLAVAGVVVVWLLARGPSTDSERLYTEGLRAARLGNGPKVRQVLTVLRDTEGYEPQVAILEGHLHAADERFDEALLSFSRAQGDERTREESYLQAGLICYDLKEFREAIQLLQRVTSWNADHRLAHRMLAAAYYDIGAMDQALEEIGHVMRLDPEDYRPHFMKAEILKDYEQFQVAATVFAEAADLVPPKTQGQQDVRVGWAECLLRLGRYQEALDVLAPLSAAAVVEVRRAEALYFLRQYDQARLRLNPVLPTVPYDVDAVTLAVRLYEQQQDYDAGMRLVEAALLRDPRNIRLLSSAADVFGAGGQLDAAASFRERAAETAVLQQEFSRLHQAAVHDLEDAGLRLQLASVAEQLGKLQIARTWLEAALGLSPQDAQVQQAWADFQQQHPQLFGAAADGESP